MPTKLYKGVDCATHRDDPTIDVFIGYTTLTVPPLGRTHLWLDTPHMECDLGCFRWEIASGGGTLTRDALGGVYYDAPEHNIECKDNAHIELLYFTVVLDKVVIGTNKDPYPRAAYFLADKDFETLSFHGWFQRPGCPQGKCCCFAQYRAFSCDGMPIDYWVGRGVPFKQPLAVSDWDTVTHKCVQSRKCKTFKGIDGWDARDKVQIARGCCPGAIGTYIGNPHGYPRCPRCGSPLLVRPIMQPQGKANVHGWRASLFCDNKACTYEKYTRDTQQTVLSRERKT